MTREINLIDLDALLRKRGKKTSKKRLAKVVGVSATTLRGYFEDRWPVLDRTVLERLADFFECSSVADLLEMNESPFFAPFSAVSAKGSSPAENACLYIRRPDADKKRLGRPIALRDNEAIRHVSKLIGKHASHVTPLEVTAKTAEKFEHRLSQNCVVLGSPMVNPASELALCHMFGVAPSASSPNAKLPFIFRTDRVSPARPNSIAEVPVDGQRGIWLRKSEELVLADYWPEDEFQGMNVEKGRDCGVIAVMNRQSDQGHPRKLIVLAGFSGVGTEAAAMALAEHYRDLEPRRANKVAWGVIEVSYQKEVGGSRDILNYNWRCRVGGRSLIE
jgi:hypothetical protein